MAYHIDVQVDGTPAPQKQTPGAVVEINAMPKNVTVKLEPASLTGDVAITTTGNPDSTELKDGAVVLDTDAATGAIEGANGFSAPKLLALKMLQGTSTPTRLEIAYKPPSGAASKIAKDFANLHGLDAGVRPLCSEDIANAGTGTFVQRNPGTVTGANFEQMKFIMHPVTISSQPLVSAMNTEVNLEYESGDASVLALYEAAGPHAAVALPKKWTQVDFDSVTKKLNVKLLASGTGYGEVVLRLRYSADGRQIAEKKLKFRVGDAPGLAGLSRVDYPNFLYGRVYSQGTSVGSALDQARYAERINRKATVYVVQQIGRAHV